MNVTVLGAGAWGTALARLLADSDQRVTLWDYFPETLAAVRATNRNERYLPGIELPSSLLTEPDLVPAVADAELAQAATGH